MTFPGHHAKGAHCGRDKSLLTLTLISWLSLCLSGFSVFSVSIIVLNIEEFLSEFTGFKIFS